MKTILSIAIASIVLIIAIACSSAKHTGATLPAYSPPSIELYKSIVHMDSVWEDSYNNCRLDKQEELISEDLEFYHDQGGLMTSKTQLIAALKNNICGKVTRELLPGSIEVYPIANYGAVEMGLHRFHNKNDTGSGEGHFARFVHLWRNENGHWRITRVISLH
ncbi:MAG TPA: nuclear transport factor 2 family protein [Ohtaekwangia sp.]|uniref:nuclear transport factor 2 family protein n=1 Tax=Ohtaekwangia sp. TaxID=2066019 RepID=UPI002F95DC2C